MKRTRITSTRAKNNLIKYFNYYENDFHIENGIHYLICKDDWGISAVDVYQEKMLTNKEVYERAEE